jgi:glycosyltransferase involved in cell wall biosynthesis
MRILLFPASYSPVLGGLQTASHQLALQFQKAGHRVQVVTQRYPRRLPASEILDGIPVRRWLFLRPELTHLRRLRPDLFIAGLYYQPLVTCHMRKFFEDFQPEVVNVHFPDSQASLVLKMRRWLPFRLVVSLHGHEIDRWDGHSPHDLYTSKQFHDLQKVLFSADVVTACSEFMLNKALALIPEIGNKSKVIYNGIDFLRFQGTTAYIHPRPYVFFFGRLVYKKGVDLMIDAFARLSKELPQIDLIIAGQGEDEQRLKEQVLRLGLAGRILLWGKATPDQVVSLLNGCQFVVIPSRQEPFGITALEAMAAGKPVLATRVGGLPEFVPEEGNLLVEPDIDSLALGLVNMVHNPKIDSVYLTNRRQAERFSWKAASDRYLEVFQNFHRVSA